MFRRMLIIPSYTWRWMDMWEFSEMKVIIFNLFIFFRNTIVLTMDNLGGRKSIWSKFSCSQKTSWTCWCFYSDCRMIHPLFQWHCNYALQGHMVYMLYSTRNIIFTFSISAFISWQAQTILNSLLNLYFCTNWALF